MSIYNYSIIDRNGSEVSLKDYKGKTLIIDAIGYVNNDYSDFFGYSYYDESTYEEE